MTFARPTLSDLIERARTDLEARLPGADARLRRSVLDVLARVNAGGLAGVYAYLDFLALQLMPDTAEAEYLDRWASIWGVARKAAASAAGAVTVTGLVGAIVPQGAELARVDGALYRTTERIVLAGVSAQVAVEAVEAGAAGVVEAGKTLTFRSPVAAVSAVVTAAAGLVGGADQETDTELLARLLARIRKPPNGGSRSDYVAWALELPGVTRAWSYANWTGPGTVGLAFVFDGRENIFPLQADLDAMAAHIEPLRPVTATPVIFAPEPWPISFLITATPDNVEVRAAIEAELRDLFAREAEPGGTMLVSHEREAISLAAGEHDHVLRSPASNQEAPPGAMPTIDGIAWQ
ncbi:baseplate J/gp47 family protein [Sphingomonas gilva]|uniref:Baseplate J/gp47 family protein n=1 Tax=Sphingomonas gilva TaxID=2305907 RepID=A0A396RSB8_9SPHN|nr:baseplate J/gp47 family protein [Sphingomonas gilva]RHW17213.1 baseplate J/gp47 family protein [Sphingomonas gilva]